MQLSRLKPETRHHYLNQKVEVKHLLFTGIATVISFHNGSHAVIEFEEPMKQQSALRQKGKLRSLTVDVKCLHV